jgi:hypothetical protein
MHASYQANGKTKRQRPKSRRSRQRHQQKQANEFQKESLATYLRIEKEIIFTYRFVVDPSLTSGHNLAIHLTLSPSWHHQKLPSPSRTWLKILPNAKKTTGYEQFEKAKERFRKHIHTQMYFAGEDNDWNPKQLFIAKEDWEVDINELPR